MHVSVPEFYTISTENDLLFCLSNHLNCFFALAFSQFALSLAILKLFPTEVLSVLTTLLVFVILVGWSGISLMRYFAKTGIFHSLVKHYNFLWEQKQNLQQHCVWIIYSEYIILNFKSLLSYHAISGLGKFDCFL